MFKHFLMALSTLSIIPIPYDLYKNACTKASAYYFPVVGMILGGLLALACCLFQAFFSPQFSALVILFVSVAISRAFHLDGLADCADAFWSSRDRERKLEIMKDSRIGVMGVLALIFILGSKYIYLERLMHLSLADVCLIVFIMVLVGRCSMNLHMILISPQEKGLGNAFWTPKSAWLAMLVLFFTLFYFYPVNRAVILLVCIILMDFLWASYVKKHINRGTGDTLGAACELSELMWLITVFEFAPLIEALMGN